MFSKRAMSGSARMSTGKFPDSYNFITRQNLAPVSQNNLCTRVGGTKLFWDAGAASPLKMAAC